MKPRATEAMAEAGGRCRPAGEHGAQAGGNDIQLALSLLYC